MGVVVPFEEKNQSAGIDVLVDLVRADMERVNQIDPVAHRLRRDDDPGGRQPPDQFRRQAAAADADARDGPARPAIAGDGHIKLAAAVEFMHTATLLHDDVVDESDMRRGKLAARMLWGNEASVLVGDFLLGQAFR